MPIPSAPPHPPRRLRRATRGLLRLAAAAGLLAPAPWAGAAEAYPKPIQRALERGATVVKKFPAASGLTGWVLSSQGRHSLAYSTADNKTLLVGDLIGGDGVVLTAGYAERHLPKPDHRARFDELGKSAYVAEGTLANPKSVVYAVIDPNCTFCHLLWKAFQPYQKIGLQVRWVLVATLGPTSMPKAIGVLGDADPRAALLRLERDMGKPFTASARTSARANPAVAASVDANGALLQRMGLAGTPVTI
ncbi:thiol:disulfide interchange protein DsbG [Massilia glaciei]|uniref:Thiol:disulfide interchange protein DsbG n=1 Tax=Massilia glaciei TaxID=1524097 RepID=A0A2U2H9U8_9BURK|nr:thiol:disulfide interchange protein DsbG [Massilia glaciei]PWF39438.1 thiol:disulfide interchange protein DsbG [Massilia glaciei]